VKTAKNRSLRGCNLCGIKSHRHAIRIRLRQVEAGNMGDCEPVGEGVVELRVHVGAGYRVYCGQRGKAMVILLCGGSKGSQAADIKRAKVYWAEWKRRQS
jgi:putative addiction module killer protein